MKHVTLCALITLLTVDAYGQENNADPDLQRLIEDIFSFQDADLNYEELYEALLLHYSDPLDLNKASQDDLRSLFILSDHQINSFIGYREKYGKLLSIYELQAIPGFEPETIYRLIPFIKIDENGFSDDNRSLLRRIWQEPNNYLLLRYERTLETKKGYKTSEPNNASPYYGSPDKLYARFRVSHSKDFSLGFTAEKDAGEQLTKNVATNTYGADFYSFHFQLQNKGRLKNLVIGDYQIQAGQSLLLAAGFSVGKGAESITTIRRSDSGIRPYTSVVETGNFRGVAGTLSLNKRLSLTSFYSRTEEDAVIRVDSAQSAIEFISSIQSTGYHRTDNERASKNQIIHQSLGGNLLYNNQYNNLQLGVTFVGDHLSRPLLLPDQPYNRFRFSGTDNFNLGFSYNYSWQNFSFFGELAGSKSGGTGIVAGVITSLTPTLESSVLFRHYARNFHSLHGNAFAESAGQNQNEKGLYWGLKYKPSRKYQFTAYFDQFKFPWLKYRVDAPSAGYEYLFRLNYKPRRGTILYAQYRCESKAVNPGSDIPSIVKNPVNGIRRNYLLSLKYPLDKVLSLQSKVQWSSYDFLDNTTHGLLILQDLNLELNRFRISTRFAIFDTDNYENRQYAYERDALYSFSLPPYSGKGTRQYILLQYKFNKHVDLWARYARTHYRDRNTIGAGQEEIEGNIKTDIKLQARVRF